jgi:hypothetical protein
MNALRWLGREAKSIAAVTLYFAAWFTFIILLKKLLLAEYGIEFNGISAALIGALVTAKVVVVLEKVPLHRMYRKWPVVADVLIRSAVYTIAVLVVLLIERAFDARAAHGGFAGALRNVLDHPDIHQIWATALCIGVAFIAFNAFAVLRREVGGRGLFGMFFRKQAADA